MHEKEIAKWLELLCCLIGEYIILTYPSEKYYVLKLISEYDDVKKDD